MYSTASVLRQSSAAISRVHEYSQASTKQRYRMSGTVSPFTTTSAAAAPPQPANLANMKTFKSTAFKLGIPEGEHNQLVNALAYKGLKNKLKKAEDIVVNGGELSSESLTSLDSHQ